MKKRVRVYIEGGAEGREANNDFRRGWKKFLRELHELARANGYQSLDIVRGKGRADTFRRFARHETDYSNDLCVLLVDAEIAVPAGARIWDIVGSREGDKWRRPAWATERHLYLMVHFVETWLVADPDALRSFFKMGFNPEQLPTTSLEERSTVEINRALDRATRDSKKGPYRHGQAHEIIEFVDPDKVKTLSHGQRLFDTLAKLIKNEPE